MIVHSPFDTLAETYDSDFTYSHIGQLQRKRVWDFLNPVLESFSRPLKILELNCGTGEDAIRLTQSRHTVIATDTSGKMIEKAKQKATLMKITDSQLQFFRCSFNEVTNEFAGEKFDLVFSNFGGLNCIDSKELQQLATNLFPLLKKDGRLFFVIMSRSCLWEIFHYSMRLKFRTAFRRRRKKIIFRSNDSEMPVYYYSPKKLKKIFSSYFESISSYPIGLFIPPSYMEKNFSKYPERLKKLFQKEKKWGKYSLFSPLADHFCITFKPLTLP